VGLFGKAVAQYHVSRFLQYVDAVDGGPSFGRSLFTRYDDVTGLIYSEAIASLEQSELQGTAVLRYGDRVLPRQVVDGCQGRPVLSVSHRGTSLLTNATLDVTPTFGITTRVDSSFSGRRRPHGVWSGD
jgi:hypothetical protein